MRYGFALAALLATTLFAGACGGGGGSGGGSVTAPPSGPPAEPPVLPPPLPVAGRPHIVLILADDLGYGSLNSYGAWRELVRTPQIDRLAQEGVRFTQASAPSSVCSPTRYGVLMGRYPWRTELKVGVVNPLDPLWPSTQRMNLPKWLQARGYVTATIGKWHLGYGTGPNTLEVEDWIDIPRPGPDALGFDYSFNVPHNHGDLFGVYFENGGVVGLRSSARRDYGNTSYGYPFIGFDAPQRVDALVTQQLATRAVEWMRERVEEGGAPFFLFFTPVALHEPITPSLASRGTSGAGSYGDFIHDLDGSVGEILEALDELGIADNTLVIFSSDNGGEIPGARDTPQRLAVRSGLAINGALRGDKHTIWEGGTRVPLLVRMPGYSRVPGGAVVDALVNLTDIFASIADLVDGGKLPEGAGPDSISFLPLLRPGSGGNRVPRSNSVTANVNGIVAIRSGEWKWIEGALPAGFQGTFSTEEARSQLYNLRDDPAETRNLSRQRPEIVERLRRELQAVRETDNSQ